MTDLIDPALAAKAEALRQRAASLRSQAESLGDPLATPYRRRAAELELAAWAFDARAGVRYEDAEVLVPAA